VKILFASLRADLKVGGLEKAETELAHALRDKGHEVLVADSYESIIARAREVDIVHYHGIWSPAHARASRVLKRQGKPQVCSIHGMLEDWAWRHRLWKKWPYYWLVERHHLHRCDLIHTTSEEESLRLSYFAPKTHIHCLPLGMVDSATPNYARSREELAYAPDEKVIVYLSRIHPKKGLDMLLQSAQKLSQHFANSKVRLVIIGDGEPAYLEKCKMIARSLDATSWRVDWLGSIWNEHKWRYLQAADLMCLPTHSENFGYVVPESLLVGTPVLTTTGTPWKDYNARSELYICEPEPISIEQALEAFLNAPVPTDDEREDTHEWVVKTWGWSALVNAYEACYTQLLQS